MTAPFIGGGFRGAQSQRFLRSPKDVILQENAAGLKESKKHITDLSQQLATAAIAKNAAENERTKLEQELTKKTRYLELQSDLKKRHDLLVEGRKADRKTMEAYLEKFRKTERAKIA